MLNYAEQVVSGFYYHDFIKGRHVMDMTAEGGKDAYTKTK
jgi:hypothetical protein